MSEEQTRRWYFSHAQNDLNLSMLCVFEDIFSLGAANWLLQNSYEKRYGFDIDIVYIPFLDGDISRYTSYRV